MKTYTPEQAAEVLQLHPVTVYRYLRKGKLHGRKIHAHAWRLTEEDLRVFLTGEPGVHEQAQSREKQSEWEKLSREEREARIEAIMNRYEHVPGALDRFLAEKHMETEMEEQRFDDRRRA